MNNTPFRSVAPILSVADVDAAIAYYTAVLDFQVGWKWGTPATVASVCRDGMELMLEAASPEPAAAAPSRVYIVLAGLDEYHARIVAAGDRVTVPLAQRAYGMKDCRIVDPDGNAISFGEPAH